MGFLKWKESDTSNIFYYAPLILVPVTIKREKVSDPFTLYFDGEEVLSNKSLIYKLKEQDIYINEFDDLEQTLDDYFNGILKAISDKKDWLISNKIFLSDFNYKKLAMYEDLAQKNWTNVDESCWDELRGSSIIEDVDFESDYDFDSHKSIEIHNVLDADSSQLEVLTDVKNGKNLVVEGPPGTGKSQTIVNLIAELMAMNKKVLFVSEKKAALDVVKDRLDSIGLGVGCLELHGKDSKINELLNELKYTLNLDRPHLKSSDIYDNLDDLKKELNNYSNTLHSIYGNTGVTAFKIIGYYIKNKQNLEKNNEELYDMKLVDVSSFDKEKRGEYLNKLKELMSYYDLIKPLSENIWNETSPKDISTADIKEIKLLLEKLIKNFKAFEEINKKIHDISGIEELNTLNIETPIDKLNILCPNLTLFKSGDNPQELIDYITIFQEKTKNIDLKIFDLDLSDINVKVNELWDNISSSTIDVEGIDKESLKELNGNNDFIKNSNLKNALSICSFEQKLSDFKSKNEFIENSNLKDLLFDSELKIKLDLFKSKSSSFLKHLNGDYRKLRKDFNSYYSVSVNDEQVIKDIEELIKVNEEYNSLKKEFLECCSLHDSNIPDKYLIDDLEELSRANIEFRIIKNNILTHSAYSMDVDTLLIESNSLLKSFKQLDDFCLKFEEYNVHTTVDSIKNDIVELMELKELLSKICDNEELGKYYFNELWDNHNSNTEFLYDNLSTLNKFNEYYQEGFFTDKTVSLIDNLDVQELKKCISQLRENKTTIVNIYNNLNDKLHYNEKLNYFSEVVNNDFNKISAYKSYVSDLLANIDNLDDYRLFIKYCQEYNDENTEAIINLIKEDKISSKSTAINLFYYNFAKTALKEIFSENKVLDDFNYSYHQQKIDEFKRLDKNVLSANIVRVEEILSQNRPNILCNTNQNSSLGILNNEFQRKRKHMPIRKLLSKTYDAITSIKPCFMMSPLSVARFLEPEIFNSYFDYVIFDEASQVKLEDSIGVFRRAKNYVVIGDTKQLPPTTFFEKENDDDENYEETQDVESILHYCKKTTETKMLKWHYRSKHESLIYVSNNEFYDNKLFVFPSPISNDKDLGLKFEYNPSTVYQRGSGANNPQEAENIVEYALNLIRKYGDSKSFGIATFSVNQRNTIQDILEDKLKDNPELEDYFSESKKESFFVKNLENIQGDERDIILISMGYGKDLNGKLSLQFGPLNKEGGDRRLNVLITRARYQCIVFANFKSSDMSTNESTPNGVKVLKTFLYYAETGELPANYHTGEDFDSPFEEAVYDFLTDEGYEVEKQVGCSGYKIDLAIVDKKDSNNYILAIECDGATYHSSRSARDRDRLRQNHLESLGWKFYRIWSTDWYHKNMDAKKRLINAVEEAFEQKNNKQIAESVESKFEPEVVFKKNEDVINDKLNDYFENYKYFTDFEKYDDFESILKALVEFESPIHRDDIYDFVKNNSSIRITQKRKNEINYILNIIYMDSIKNINDFYFDVNFDYKNMKVRKRKNPNIDRISNMEIEKAIIFTLEIELSSDRISLIKSASSRLGFKRSTQRVKQRFNLVIDNLMNKSIKENNGVIELMDS